MSALYQRLEHALEALHCDLGPAECHGMLTGMLCGASKFDHDAWLRHFSGQDEIAAFRAGENETLLAELRTNTSEALNSGDFEFELLLPDDDDALSMRVNALSAWCRGFLSGLGASGFTDMAVLSDDAAEFLRDAERFRAIDIGEDEGEDEVAFFELTEFVRMGALIVYGDLRGVPNKTQTMH